MLKHHYSEYANKTVNFIGTDTNENLTKNLSDEYKRNYLLERDWANVDSIEYKFNHYGFRTNGWDKIHIHSIALGCSHTMGVGLPMKATWPAVLSRLVKKPILNFGLGAGSLDTCVRILDYYINKIRLDTIYVLEPEPARFELHYLGRWLSITPGNVVSEQKNTGYAPWVASDENVIANQRKNHLALEYLCSKNNLKLKILPSWNRGTFKDDWARDFVHNGIEWNKSVAQAFADL